MPTAKTRTSEHVAPAHSDDEVSQPFVGRWNQLVSTTNWEKGAIITQWRAERIAADAPVADYSDEAWSRLVGGVTGQHVGRLRRVHERFGEVYEQYAGLYWSHFHAALEWDDAEMWLEGAVQSAWSVSQMRRTRWETLGQVEDEAPSDNEIVAGELDEDFEPALKAAPSSPHDAESPAPDARSSAPATHKSKSEARGAERDEDSDDEDGASIYSEDGGRGTVAFVRPFENLGDLPDDLAEAFEAFKLAILRHKTDDWKQISRDDVLASLEALKELALAPSMEDAVF